MSEKAKRKHEVLIALQQALLGEIGCRIRTIIVKYTNASIHFDVYVDGEILEEDRESMMQVDTELVAASPSSHTISHDVIRLDAPASIPKEDIWVYCRREPIDTKKL